ncbi:MAG: TerB N-terminal domain-containing protein [Sutterella sp.]|nr:TerB N-terminal domain-containing protein [Sutterella sp.]
MPYVDEEIPPPAGRFAARAAAAEQIRPRYREMLAIAERGWTAGKSDEAVFYEQACFMADFEEDRCATAGFVSFYPTYADMSLRQLQAYFYWRTQLRKGHPEAAPVAFAFIHVYELLHGVGAQTPAACLEALKAFAKAWQRFDSTLERYLPFWMDDFVAFWGLSEDLLRRQLVPESHRVLNLMFSPGWCRDHEAELIRRLEDFAGASALKSVFRQSHEALCRRVAVLTWRRLLQLRPREELKSWFGSWLELRRRPFERAVFWDGLRAPDHVTQMSAEKRAVVREGRLRFESFFFERGRRPAVAELMKAAEDAARRLEGVRGRRPPGLPDAVLAAAADAEALIRRERREAANPAASIDLSRLAGIRADALETQAKLTVTEEENGLPDDADLPVSSEPVCESAPETPTPASLPEQPCRKVKPADDQPAESSRDEDLLNEAEKLFLGRLLEGECRPDLLETGLSHSMIVDGINGKLFEAVGDAVLELLPDGIGIVEDYEDEVRALIS